MANETRHGEFVAKLKNLQNWLAEPVKATFKDTFSGVIVSGAILGVSISSVDPKSPSLIQLGPMLEEARRVAVAWGVAIGISHVMMKLRGKEDEDLETRMVAGFGSGVMLSLVTGSRGPEVIPFGALSALMNGGVFKVLEILERKKTSPVTPTHSSSLHLPKSHNSPGEFVATLSHLQSWLAKPVENTVIGTVTGAISGVCFHILSDLLFLGRFPSSLDPKFLSCFGGYQPLVQSLMVGSRLEQARNFAVINGALTGIFGVMEKLTGKEDVDVPRCMVASFGSGVALSLVTGLRLPEAISVGVMLGLVTGGLFKAITVGDKELSEVKAEDMLHDKTKDKFSSIGLGIDHHAMNFNTGFFTSNALSLHRKETKKGGKRTWFY